jgi:MraZ protein
VGRRLRFRGEGIHKVDAKGRVSIPADFRRVIEAGDPDYAPDPVRTGKPDPANFVIFYGDKKPCLRCYTVQAFEELEEQIAEHPLGSERRRILSKLYSGRSLTSTLDPSGRIVLPIARRRQIGLEGEAYFIASGDTFEIWNPATYEAVEQAATDAFLENLPDDFDPLALLDPNVEI